MGEKGRVRTALAILGVTGSIMIWSSFDARVKVPEGAWPVASAAALYFFTTGRTPGKHHDDDEDHDHES